MEGRIAIGLAAAKVSLVWERDDVSARMLVTGGRWSSSLAVGVALLGCSSCSSGSTGDTTEDSGLFQPAGIGNLYLWEMQAVADCDPSVPDEWGDAWYSLSETSDDSIVFSAVVYWSSNRTLDWAVTCEREGRWFHGGEREDEWSAEVAGVWVTPARAWVQFSYEWQDADDPLARCAELRQLTLVGEVE